MTTVEEPKIVDAKVVLLGALGVGKTSIITRYSQKKFLGTTSPTIGASFTTLRVNVGDARVRIQLWDTAGQERFRAMAPLYYRKANAAIVAYDITSSSSYEAMKQWVMELRRNVEEAIVLVLVGNKCDLTQHRVVDKAVAQKFARDIGGHFFECSALSNEAEGLDACNVIFAPLRGNGIDDMFRDLAHQIVEAEERAASHKCPYQVEPYCLPTDPSLGGSLDTFTLSRTLRIERLPSDPDVLKPQSHCFC